MTHFQSPIADAAAALNSGDGDLIRSSLRNLREIDRMDPDALAEMGAGTPTDVQEIRGVAGDLGVPFPGDRRHGRTLREAVDAGDIGLDQAVLMDRGALEEWNANHEPDLLRTLGIEA